MPSLNTNPNAPKYRELDTSLGMGRGAFRRMKKAGAFNEGSTLIDDWKNNPLDRFTGPGKAKMNAANTGRAVSDQLKLIAGGRADAADTAAAANADSLKTLTSAGTAVRAALDTPVISPEMLRRSQAAVMDRVAREGFGGQAGLGASAAGQGLNLADLSAARAGLMGDTSYRAGQAENEQNIAAAATNREGILAAIKAAGENGQDISQTIETLMGIQSFREGLTADDIKNLQTMFGLKVAAA